MAVAEDAAPARTLPPPERFELAARTFAQTCDDVLLNVDLRWADADVQTVGWLDLRVRSSLGEVASLAVPVRPGWINVDVHAPGRDPCVEVTGRDGRDEALWTEVRCHESVPCEGVAREAPAEQDAACGCVHADPAGAWILGVLAGLWRRRPRTNADSRG